MTDERSAGEGHQGGASGAPTGWGEAHSRTITWYLPAHHAAGFAALSGLDYLRGVIDGQLPPPPIASVATIEMVAADVGEVVLRCVPDESWLNPNRDVHGGLLCTLMDSAMGMAVMSTRESAQEHYTSIELKVSFLKPLPFDGRAVTVRGRTLRVGRRVAFAEAHAHCPDGALIGHASSSLAAVGPV